VIKFVVKLTERGWAIYRDELFVSVHPTRRQALVALGVLRAELKRQGQRSLIKFEARMTPKSD
jgi:hypothetical protein